MTIHTRLLFSLLILIVLGISVSHAKAQGIVVQFVEISHDNGRYALDADIQYNLSEVAQEALHKGVALTFKLTIAVLEPRPLVWDQPIISEERSYTLNFQALTNQYRVQRGDSVLLETFPTLNSALSEIGSLRNIEVALFERGLRENNEYVGIRAWLDIESLPVPMRLLAYSQPSWRHNSGWYRWKPNQ